MIHLLAHVLAMGDLRLLLLMGLECLSCGVAAVILLRWSPGSQRPPALKTVLFAALVTIDVWLSFKTQLRASFPRLRLVVPGESALAGLAVCFAGTSAAGLLQLLSRRSARNAMLAGSIMAGSVSCMIFTCMAGVVRPFTLAYDLTAVAFVAFLAAALCSFALWELDGVRPRRRLIAAGLFTAALLAVSVGSLGAILPFEGWINAVNGPDNITSSPMAIIVATEVVACLILTMAGSFLDNRTAARDQIEADRLRQLAEGTFEAIIIHRDGVLLDANERMLRLIGRSLQEVRGTQITRYVTPRSGELLSAQWQAGESGSAMPMTEIEIVGADGFCCPVETLSRGIVYRGEAAQVIALRDVTERREAEKRIHFLAHHDPLTELPNRLRLHQDLDHTISLSRRTGAPAAILCLDLDGFKTVNDTFGHQAGDTLLRQVAARLRDNVRESDLVARVGGDEFIVLQNSGAQPESAVQGAGRLVDCLAAPFTLDGQVVNIGTSIGIAVYPQDGHTTVTLLKNADIALHRAKVQGRGQFSLFEVGMDLALRERRELERELRFALARGDLSVSFQPMFDTGQQLVCLEALVRWNHAERGSISPAEFIPLAEESGLIIPLGEWVLRTACREAAGWTQPCRVAVNLSPVQFARGRLPEIVGAALRDSGLSVGRLELEITEGVLIKDPEQALNTLCVLRAMGVRLVLDDFGTGYSSLAYLHRFPFDKLKVDRSFIERIEFDAGSRAIVNAIIAMSRNLDLEVTAEGIETNAQLDLLTRQGCHELQGFLLARPIPQAGVIPYLETLLDGFLPCATPEPALCLELSQAQEVRPR